MWRSWTHRADRVSDRSVPPVECPKSTMTGNQYFWIYTCVISSGFSDLRHRGRERSVGSSEQGEHEQRCSVHPMRDLDLVEPMVWRREIYTACNPSLMTKIHLWTFLFVSFLFDVDKQVENRRKRKSGNTRRLAQNTFFSLTTFFLFLIGRCHC